TGTTDLSLAPGGCPAPLCGAALRACAGALSPPQSDAATTAQKTARSPGGVVAGGGGAATRPGGVGRPALGRPLYARRPEPAAGSGLHGPHAYSAHVPPRVSPVLGHARASNPGHPQPPGAHPGRGDVAQPHG